MEGLCIAMKNRSEATNAVASMFGGKQSKSRWFVLKGHGSEPGLVWYETKSKPNGSMKSKGTVSLSNFKEVRDHTLGTI